LRKSKALGGLVGAAIGGLGFALGDGNGGLNAIIEFFDPIKPKGALLSKTKSTGKIKDKGST
jgi:predicted lipid-binding transport protein (Tim44 family)